jgi:dihydroxyacetone kinase DhaKLM complex PTS-EIIA-like component DhaM
VPQSCRAPGELKVVFCQATIVTGGVAAAAEAEAEMAIRTVVADS